MRVRLMNLLFGLSLALLSCHPSARRCMTQAEMLLQERPDSALSLLQGLSGQRLTEKERARYALLTTIAQDKCYLDVNDDSLALFAYRYYSRYGDKQERMKASYYLGTIYQCAGDLIEATSFFKEAEEIIGYALIRHTCSPLYLRQFYIDRAYRRKHYGEKAFHELLKLLQVDTIDIDVLPWNEAGLQFWKSLGFTETCISMNYKSPLEI